MSEITYTESALADKVREFWKHYKNDEYPRAGDYYYHIIDFGVFHNEIIEIPIRHFSPQIKNILDELQEHTIREIISKAIRDLFLESRPAWVGAAVLKRIHWRFI